MVELLELDKSKEKDIISERRELNVNSSMCIQLQHPDHWTRDIFCFFQGPLMLHTSKQYPSQDATAFHVFGRVISGTSKSLVVLCCMHLVYLRFRQIVCMYVIKMRLFFHFVSCLCNYFLVGLDHSSCWTAS